MDNEKYGIELELITDKFNSKMQKVKKEVNSVSKVKKVEDYSYLKKAPISAWKQWTSETQKVNKSIKQIQNNFKGLQPIAEQFSQRTVKGLKKVSSGIKRFGLSLLGIRSMWAIASRASSAYLAEDEELSNRLKSVWVGLGALLAPIIEGLINIFAKAIKYLAIFIKALTGVDLLAKASAKSLAKTTKSAKGLNKALAGFDELNNLDTDTNGGDTGLGDVSALKGLEDVEINTTWADKIRQFGEWVRDNKDTILGFIATLGLTFTAIKLGTFIGSLADVGKGLKLIAGIISTIVGKLASKFMQFLKYTAEQFGLIFKFISTHIQTIIGIGIVIAGIVVTVQAIIDFINDPSWENFGRIIRGIGIIILGFGVILHSIPLIVIGAIAIIVGTIIKHWDEIKAVLGEVGGWIYDHLIRPVGDFFANLFSNISNWVEDSWNNAMDILSRIKDWINSNVIMPVKNFFTDLWDNIKTSFQKAWDFILNAFSKGGQIFNGIKEGIVTVFKTVVNFLIKGINTVIKVPFDAINGLLNAIKGVNVAGIKPFDGLWNWNPLPVPQIPQLAVGTNYVPEDQLAMIHKGEAVVPKKFNSQEYFGNNDETNSLLRQVIEAVNNIEINPYTTVKDVGKASLSYINSKSRQLGTSVVY